MRFTASRKNLWLYSILGLLGVVIVYFILDYFGRHPSTDDAYVQADTINIAAQVTGPVEAIFVKDHQAVKAGDVLFSIEPAPFQIAVDKAQAAVSAQQAELLLAENNARRILALVKNGQETKANGDLTQARLDSARAELTADEAALAQAKLDLEHTRILAPRSGIVTQFVLQPGNNVLADETLFKLVEQDYFWVDANFKETQVAHIKPNQPVKITLDMFPKHVFHGVVDAVSSASGEVFSLLPPENASGNWVKVTQRFPVKILIQDPDASFPLRAGATATVTVDTTMRT